MSMDMDTAMGKIRIQTKKLSFLCNIVHKRNSKKILNKVRISVSIDFVLAAFISQPIGYPVGQLIRYLIRWLSTDPVSEKVGRDSETSW